MVRTPSRSVTRHLCRSVPVLLLLGIATLAWAQDASFSANVDKTTVDVGSPIHLTMTLRGNLSGAQMQQPKFPDGFSVAGRSQSTNFAIRAGAIERSTTLLYVLIPEKAGMFKLGPFTLTRAGKEIQTTSIEITIKMPTVPQALKSKGERFTL